MARASSKAVPKVLQGLDYASAEAFSIHSECFARVRLWQRDYSANLVRELLVEGGETNGTQ